jgi:DNA-binding transcriptional LysR family regulator
MELRHLRYFVAVAEELSFRRAAARLRVAQPALSRQVRSLEDELGARLLDRDKHSVRLTAAGTAFLPEARAVLERAEQAGRVARQTQTGAIGPLNIGYVWGLFHRLVPGILGRFRANHPNVGVNLHDLTAAEQAARLEAGKLDAAFLGAQAEAERFGLESEIVGQCEFWVALPSSHTLCRRRQIQLTQLANEFFVTISEDSFPGAAAFVFDVCARAGFKPRVLQAAQRGSEVISLIGSGCGVALVPEPLRALPAQDIAFRPLTSPPRIELCLAWSKSRSAQCPLLPDLRAAARPSSTGNP